MRYGGNRMDANESQGGQVWAELKPPRHEPAKTAWLMSFIDLTGILVGFFVLVFSTQVIDRSAWQDVSGGFRAAFNPEMAIAPVVPEGRANGYEVVAMKRDVLPYLDSLLRSRMADDPLWKQLKGNRSTLRGEAEMVYPLPQDVLDFSRPGTLEAWKRLANVVLKWKNPVGVRVVIADPAAADKAAAAALQLAAAMHAGGAVHVTAEVVSGNIPDVQLVVRGEQL